MREFQERRKMKKLLHSRYMIAALFIVCAILVHAVWGVYEKYRKSEDLATRTKKDLASLETRQKSLSESLDALNTAEGQERELRDRFGAVKEGERMIVLVDNEATGKPASSSDKGWWRSFLGFLGF